MPPHAVASSSNAHGGERITLHTLGTTPTSVIAQYCIGCGLQLNAGEPPLSPAGVTALAPCTLHLYELGRRRHEDRLASLLASEPCAPRFVILPHEARQEVKVLLPRLFRILPRLFRSRLVLLSTLDVCPRVAHDQLGASRVLFVVARARVVSVIITRAAHAHTRAQRAGSLADRRRLTCNVLSVSK